MASITIVDESTVDTKRVWSLDILSWLEETLPLRELIRQRVYQEVTEYNARQIGNFHGLVQPTDTERTLNGYRLRTPKQLDWEAQYEKAIEAFQKRAYIVLVNNKQVADLDTHIEVSATTEVTFFKLVPLVGG